MNAEGKSMLNNRVILDKIRTIEYEHPLDRQALATLKNTAGLPKVIEFINKHSIDRITKVNHTGSYLLAGENQFAKTYSLFNEACKILDMEVKPQLYIREGYAINAYATCNSYPIVTIYTGTIEKLTDEELNFIIGHELGHIKSEHLLYQDVASKMSIISRIITDVTFGFGGVVSTSLEVALLYWSRMAEYTCDRAGLLVCQNYDAAISAIMKLAGGVLVENESVSTDAFMKQVSEFENYDHDSIDKVAKVFSVLDDTHPWTVMRAAQLKKWYEDGSYEKTINRSRDIDKIDKYVCSACGKLNKENSKFCSACGSKL